MYVPGSSTASNSCVQKNILRDSAILSVGEVVRCRTQIHLLLFNIINILRVRMSWRQLCRPASIMALNMQWNKAKNRLLPSYLCEIWRNPFRREGFTNDPCGFNVHIELSRLNTVIRSLKGVFSIIANKLSWNLKVRWRRNLSMITIQNSLSREVKTYLVIHKSFCTLIRK